MAKRPSEHNDLSAYDGREHAQVKHFLLETYLERFLMILGHNEDSIAFVDGFSGPWLSENQQHEDTSFGLSWSTVLGAHNALAARGKFPKLRLLWIEADPEKYARLSRYANTCKRSGISVETWEGKFEQRIDELATWIGKDYALVFIDPTGYKGLIDANVLAPLLALPRAEVLINYMWQFIGYAMAQAKLPGNKANLERIFGSDVERLAGIKDPAEKERQCLLRYEDSLRHASKIAGERRLRVTSFPIHYATNPTKPKYFLVYATHNARGLITFAEQAEKAGSVRRKVFFRTHTRRREVKSNVDDMFAALDPPDTETRDAARQPWLAALSHPGAELVVNVGRWADLLEAGRCTPAELQLGLKELIHDGVLENLDATRNRRTRFVHYEKDERIRRRV